MRTFSPHSDDGSDSSVFGTDRSASEETYESRHEASVCASNTQVVGGKVAVPHRSLSAFRHLSVRFWTIHAFVRMWASPNAICKHSMEYMRRRSTTSSTMMNVPYQSSRHGLRCCPCDGGRVAPAGTKLHRFQPHLPSMQLSFPEQFVRKLDTEHSGCSTRRNWSLFHEYGALSSCSWRRVRTV